MISDGKKIIFRDRDIRQALLYSLNKKYASHQGTIIIEEFGLCQGDARIDLVVLNRSLHGFEIKSQKDTLKRLFWQSSFYSTIFDFMTIVASSNHIARILETVPKWWGIIEVRTNRNNLQIRGLRPSLRNKSIDPDSLVQLLWRDEAFGILKERNLLDNSARKSRRVLWKDILNYLAIDEIRREVRNRIKIRSGWRVGKQPGSYGD